MIGRIQGILQEKQAPYLLVNVNGVSYEIHVPMTTVYQLPEVGQPVTLHTHFIVREDAQLLYGFMELRERSLFRTLIKVNGVGAKLALTILSGIETDAFVRCVRDGDTASLVRLPGVGKKTAERLLVEMKDRLEDWQLDPAEAVSGTLANPDNAMLAEAESALVALGYKPAEASKAIGAVNNDSIRSSHELIRAALKSMVS